MQPAPEDNLSGGSGCRRAHAQQPTPQKPQRNEPVLARDPRSGLPTGRSTRGLWPDRDPNRNHPHPEITTQTPTTSSANPSTTGPGPTAPIPRPTGASGWHALLASGAATSLMPGRDRRTGRDRSIGGDGRESVGCDFLGGGASSIQFSSRCGAQQFCPFGLGGRMRNRASSSGCGGQGSCASSAGMGGG